MTQHHRPCTAEPSDRTYTSADSRAARLSLRPWRRTASGRHREPENIFREECRTRDPCARLARCVSTRRGGAPYCSPMRPLQSRRSHREKRCASVRPCLPPPEHPRKYEYFGTCEYISLLTALPLTVISWIDRHA